MSDDIPFFRATIIVMIANSTNIMRSPGLWLKSFASNTTSPVSVLVCLWIWIWSPSLYSLKLWCWSIFASIVWAGVGVLPGVISRVSWWTCFTSPVIVSFVKVESWYGG